MGINVIMEAVRNRLTCLEDVWCVCVRVCVYVCVCVRVCVCACVCLYINKSDSTLPSTG